jgi:integrase
MGRRLAGPVKLPNSGPNWYARLTVKPTQRALVGRSRLIRSLGTTDHAKALERWPAAYKALQKEYELLIQKAKSGERVKREEIRQRLPLVWEEEELSTLELAEILTDERFDHPDEASALFEDTYTAIKTRRTLSFNWAELVDLHAETIARRRGEPLSQSWFKAARQAVSRVLEVNESPDTITKEEIRALMEQLRTKGLSDKTISTQFGVLQSLIQTGMEEDKLTLAANPFRSVRFSASTKEQDRYLPFDLKTQLPLLLTEAEHAWIFELLCTTGLRIGELLNRRQQDIQGQMLVIAKTPDWKPKTKSSYRRVPIPLHLLGHLKDLIPVSSPGAWEQRLRPQVRNLFDNKQLVIHSCRHTFKSLARKVGMPSDVSDEIDGHKKKDVSTISDHYGDYPDDVLIKWVDVVSDEIQSIMPGKTD